MRSIGGYMKKLLVVLLTLSVILTGAFANGAKEAAPAASSDRR